MPFISAAGEIKTKPTQHSVMRLREIGLEPDILVCRTEDENHLTSKLKSKLGLFCNIEKNYVFESPDVETIYEIPLVLFRQGFDRAICKRLLLRNKKHTKIKLLEKFIRSYKNPRSSVTIAMCGKYNSLHDAYKSILEALIHAGVDNISKVNIKWVDTEKLEKNNNQIDSFFKNVDGIIIPGGFGDRGIEGKILSSKYARENNIPFLGICLGLQCAVIDYARHVCDMKNANSTEFNSNVRFPVIDLMSKQKNVHTKGATMRLGKYNCNVKGRTKAYSAYGKSIINERHRHRYEVNNKFRDKLIDNGLIVSGINKKLDLVEMVELKNHPWFVGVQFHPELKSRVLRSHPLFREFIASAIKYDR